MDSYAQESSDLLNKLTPSGQNDDQSMENEFLLIGKHEIQISEGGDSDLPKHKKNCKKNPGHPEFIPIESFSLEHLPKDLQDADLYEFIKATAVLTVKLSVTMISPQRPQFWPNSTTPYPLNELRGKNTLRTGSGRVVTMMDSSNLGHRKCPCAKCKVSGKPSKLWWKVWVATAAHVVVDDIEASHTTLRFFYDREDSPEFILKDNVCVEYVQIHRDKCLIHFVTCDQYVGKKLYTIAKTFEDLWKKITGKYTLTKDIHKFNCIVSHPHGCSKQVSVGQWLDKKQEGNDIADFKFTYLTCTCPGSSGAGVYCLGYHGWNANHLHSGCSDTGINYSGASYIG